MPRYQPGTAGSGGAAWGKPHRQRLEAVRRDLVAAGLGDVMVTDVALRYGFEQHCRFAASYREAFSELPSETLRRATSC